MTLQRLNSLVPPYESPVRRMRYLHEHTTPSTGRYSSGVPLSVSTYLGGYLVSYSQPVFRSAGSVFGAGALSEPLLPGSLPQIWLGYGELLRPVADGDRMFQTAVSLRQPDVRYLSHLASSRSHIVPQHLGLLHRILYLVWPLGIGPRWLKLERTSSLAGSLSPGVSYGVWRNVSRHPVLRRAR